MSWTGGFLACEIHRPQRHQCRARPCTPPSRTAAERCPLWAPTQAPLTVLQHSHGSAMAGRTAPAFPALALPTAVRAVRCFLPFPLLQQSGKASFDGGNWSQLPPAAFLPTHGWLMEKWGRGASCQHGPTSRLQHISPACKCSLTSLGNEGVQLVPFVWYECPMTVYFNRLAAFNSSWGVVRQPLLLGEP